MPWVTWVAYHVSTLTDHFRTMRGRRTPPADPHAQRTIVVCDYCGWSVTVTANNPGAAGAAAMAHATTCHPTWWRRYWHRHGETIVAVFLAYAAGRFIH